MVMASTVSMATALALALPPDWVVLGEQVRPHVEGVVGVGGGLGEEAATMPAVEVARQAGLEGRL